MYLGFLHRHHQSMCEASLVSPTFFSMGSGLFAQYAQIGSFAEQPSEGGAFQIGVPEPCAVDAGRDATARTRLLAAGAVASRQPVHSGVSQPCPCPRRGFRLFQAQRTKLLLP